MAPDPNPLVALGLLRRDAPKTVAGFRRWRRIIDTDGAVPARIKRLFVACAATMKGYEEMGLRELIVNAIEHGNLEISCDEKSELLREGRWQEEVARRLEMPEYRDRRATVQFRRESRRAIFQVRDEGAGFDFTRYLKFDPARLLAPNGRRRL